MLLTRRLCRVSQQDLAEARKIPGNQERLHLAWKTSWLELFNTRGHQRAPVSLNVPGREGQVFASSEKHEKYVILMIREPQEAVSSSRKYCK